MKKSFGLIVLLVAFVSCNRNCQSSSVADTPVAPASDSIPVGVKALLHSYPEYILAYRNNSVIFKNGAVIEYDDGLEKTPEELLSNADIEDMFHGCYVRKTYPHYMYDIGRVNAVKFLDALYGDTRFKIRKNLVPVEWFGQKLLFTSVGGANLQLEKVAEELSHYPELERYLTHAHTFHWRDAHADDGIRSHRYGFSIDISIRYADSWHWNYYFAEETSLFEYCNQIPEKIIEIFEKYGFIWGGNWYHFYTMHFEYRPEILEYTRLNTSE